MAFDATCSATLNGRLISVLIPASTNESRAREASVDAMGGNRKALAVLASVPAFATLLGRLADDAVRDWPGGAPDLDGDLDPDGDGDGDGDDGLTVLGCLGGLVRNLIRRIVLLLCSSAVPSG